MSEAITLNTIASNRLTLDVGTTARSNPARAAGYMADVIPLDHHVIDFPSTDDTMPSTTASNNVGIESSEPRKQRHS